MIAPMLSISRFWFGLNHYTHKHNPGNPAPRSPSAQVANITGGLANPGARLAGYLWSRIEFGPHLHVSFMYGLSKAFSLAGVAGLSNVRAILDNGPARTHHQHKSCPKAVVQANMISKPRVELHPTRFVWRTPLSGTECNHRH
jgi:hypothetical protein